MGKIINNPITSTFSGSLGEFLVFRQSGNRTFFAKKPTPSKKPATPAQRSSRNDFNQALYYASAMLQDPEQCEWYNIVAKVNGVKTAQLSAIHDYRTKPEIERINTKRYQGKVGDIIHIEPKTMLKITRIDVTIYNADGTIVETGQAMKNAFNFKYCATVPNNRVSGSRIELVTHDRLRKTCKIVEHMYG